MSIRLPTDREGWRRLLDGSSDDELGKIFLGVFIETTAERRGASALQVQAMGNAIVEALRTSEVLNVAVGTIPVEKALRHAARGEFAAAGRIFRGLLEGEGVPVFLKSWAQSGIKFSKDQSERAKKPRGKVSGSGESIGEIISRIESANPEESAKELWSTFFAELDALGLDPHENVHETDLKKSSYAYDDARCERKSISFGQFANVVSEYRAKKKSG